jgi:alkylated DNA repair protein (DNA oxidative demethylase)
MPRDPAPLDLFEDHPARDLVLGPGGVLLREFAKASDRPLLAALADVLRASPFRHMVTPGGFTMSVAMTNCGEAGWVTDRTGYRYDSVDPANGRPWPAMPPVFAELAARAADKAGFSAFVPDACLINRYIPGARLTLHQDKNERDFDAPIVSVSLGLPATFLWGGLVAVRPTSPPAPRPRRRGGLGRAGADDLSRHRHLAGRRAHAHRRRSIQPDFSAGALVLLCHSICLTDR